MFYCNSKDKNPKKVEILKQIDENPKASFASVVKDSTVDPKIADAAVVSTKGGFNSVKVPQNLLVKCIALCSANSLIGHLILQKGEAPYTLPTLKITLTLTWGLKGNWWLISLGRGYYQIMLDSKESKLNILQKGTISLKPGLMRLQEWQPNFDHAAQKTTRALI